MGIFQKKLKLKRAELCLARPKQSSARAMPGTGWSPEPYRARTEHVPDRTCSIGRPAHLPTLSKYHFDCWTKAKALVMPTKTMGDQSQQF